MILCIFYIKMGEVYNCFLFECFVARFGRRNLLVVSIATVGCLGVALHFVRRLIVFLSLRFIQSIFIQVRTTFL